MAISPFVVAEINFARPLTDEWLKGVDTGLMHELSVNMFVMGDNVWREEHAWPLARTQYTSCSFHSQGTAPSLHGDGRLAL
jgi:hypothetical protein